MMIHRSDSLDLFFWYLCFLQAKASSKTSSTRPKQKQSWSTFNSDDPLNQIFLFLHEKREHWVVKLWDTVASFEDNIDHMTSGHMKCPSDKRSTRWKGNMVVVTSMLSGTVLIYRNFRLHISRKPRCMCNEMITVSRKPHEIDHRWWEYISSQKPRYYYSLQKTLHISHHENPKTHK